MESFEIISLKAQREVARQAQAEANAALAGLDAKIREQRKKEEAAQKVILTLEVTKAERDALVVVASYFNTVPNYLRDQRKALTAENHTAAVSGLQKLYNTANRR